MSDSSSGAAPSGTTAPPGFSVWIDLLARPTRRLPERRDDALAYVTDALDHLVFVEWTPRSLVQRFRSPGEAKQHQPAVFQLLLLHDRVVQYWSAGQIVTAPAPDAPPPEVVLNRLLRALPTRFRRADAGVDRGVVPGTVPRGRREATIVITQEPLDATSWLQRAGRYFNGDTGTNTLGVTDDAAALKAFLQDRASRTRDTQRTYVHEIRRLIAWAQTAGIGPLSDLSREALLAYRDALPQVTSLAHASAGPLAPRSVRRALAVVKSLFSYWSQTGYLKANPASALGGSPPDRASLRPERFLPSPALAAGDRWLADTAAGPGTLGVLRRAAIFALYRYAGIRVAELEWSGDTGLPRITVDAQAGWTLEVQGKGSRQRAVPLPICCVTVLRRYRQARGLAEVPAAFETVSLIDGERGTGLGKSGLYREVKAALIQIAGTVPGADPGSLAMLHRASPHWLRHGYAHTLVVEHGVPLPVAQGLLGHASVTTTSTYAQTDLTEARRFVNQTFDRDPPQRDSRTDP
jgi:integrase/recombinase XerC